MHYFTDKEVELYQGAVSQLFFNSIHLKHFKLPDTGASVDGIEKSLVKRQSWNLIKDGARLATRNARHFQTLRSL